MAARRAFFFTIREWPYRLVAVRVCLLIVILLFQMITASAQEQERKLIDRLLKPDAKLQYPQQTKSFSQQRTTPTHSSATRSFYIAEKNLSKNFVADRQFATTSYSSRNFETKAATQMKVQKTSSFSTHPAQKLSTAASGSKSFS